MGGMSRLLHVTVIGIFDLVYRHDHLTPPHLPYTTTSILHYHIHLTPPHQTYTATPILN